MNIEDFANMSDEELVKLSAPTPVVPEQEEETSTNPEAEAPEGEAEPTQEEDGQATEGGDNEGGAEGDDEAVEKPEGDDLSDDDLAKQDAPPSVTEEGENPKDTPEAKSNPQDQQSKDEKPQASAEQQINYKSEYEKLIGKPIKANGKEIVLKNADEVLRLVQQGAGYAQKMEQLKPARRSAAMLEQAGLLGNEQALAQMIDIYNGDLSALTKLMQDLNIDPLSLDNDGNGQYTPKSHIPSDEAVNFHDTLKEVRTLEGGNEALALIDAMDAKSKELLWGNSEAVRQLYDYKQSGIYDRVATEVQRRQMLGAIPPNTPFIVAFGQVGEEMFQAEAQRQTTPAPVSDQTPPAAEPANFAPRTPIATGPAPRRTAAPDARAIAAAAPRNGIGQAKPSIDIFTMSDEDFEKLSAPPQ